MEQVDRIFSSTRKGSGGRSIDTWGDVGLTGDWASKPISIYGRNTISGTYEFFRQTALYSGEYKPEVKLQVGSEAVVEGVAGDKFAIGYSGLGYKTDGVRAVPLSVFFGAKCYDTSVESVPCRKIPARALSLYLREQKARRTARRAARRVHQIYSVQGRPDADGKRRLLPDHRGNPRGANCRSLGLSTPRNNRLLRASLANKSHSTNLRLHQVSMWLQDRSSTTSA